MAERPDASAWLPGIKIPTLVLAGSEDQIIPLNKAETIVQLLSKGWLVQVAGAGHMPMMEAPKKTAEAILQLICSAGGC
jgi:pimeloyl-ACP methyl ester carboxylesterase